jgi:prepilin-type N-terminal cleavage/methylation domain-containing protein
MRTELKMNEKFKREQGMTLVELLVALVISGLLLAAAYRTFISQQKTFVVQDQVVDMQQNMRAAINRMTTDIRMAVWLKDGSPLSAAGMISSKRARMPIWGRPSLSSISKPGISSGNFHISIQKSGVGQKRII